MRTQLTIFLFIISQALVKSQTKTTDLLYKDDVYQESLSYLVGSDKIPGYQIQVHSIKPVKQNVMKSFSNGKSAPILQTYVINKGQYIGGVLQNEKDEKTIITDIALVEFGKTIKFIVTGKKFSREFTLENGVLLKETESSTIFHTENVGIWRIFKK